MKRKRILIILCVIALPIIPFAIGESFPIKRAQVLNHNSHGTAQAGTTVPDHVIYGFLFERVVSVKIKIREYQSQGRISKKPTYALQKEAKLTEGQASMLEAIALACQQEVARQDERARAIVFAYRAQFPNGRIPDGVTPPPPPPELKVMWEERNAMILRARDRLQAAFGKEVFHQFDQHVKFPHGADDVNIRKRMENMNPVTLNP
ncbi:MAG: hypothetical protein H0T60_16905 [Acidobacteria bacterium]|nr:hypothetical protein [Acidobacteriota bacterium]